MFCNNCGSQIDDNAVVCVKCGVAVAGRELSTGKSGDISASWVTTLLLCLFFGGLGIHNFYTKNSTTGAIQLILGILSCGAISCIWAFIDLVRIVSGTFRMGDGRILTR